MHGREEGEWSSPSRCKNMLAAKPRLERWSSSGSSKSMQSSSDESNSTSSSYSTSIFPVTHEFDSDTLQSEDEAAVADQLLAQAVELLFEPGGEIETLEMEFNTPPREDLSMLDWGNMERATAENFEVNDSPDTEFETMFEDTEHEEHDESEMDEYLGDDGRRMRRASTRLREKTSKEDETVRSSGRPTRSCTMSKKNEEDSDDTIEVDYRIGSKAEQQEREKEWDCWVVIDVQEGTALCYATEQDIKNLCRDSSGKARESAKSNVLREKSTNAPTRKAVYSKQSRNNRRSERSDHTFRRGPSRGMHPNHTGQHYTFPIGIDQLTRETLLLCLDDKTRVEEGNDVAMLLDLFNNFEAASLGGKRKSERLAEMARELNFRVDVPDGLRRPLAVLQTRLLLWCADEKLPRSRSAMTTQIAIKAISFIVETVEDDSTDDRWEVLQRQRDIKITSLSKLRQSFYGLIQQIVRDPGLPLQ